LIYFPFFRRRPVLIIFFRRVRVFSQPRIYSYLIAFYRCARAPFPLLATFFSYIFVCGTSSYSAADHHFSGAHREEVVFS
jgi:hypothetical protein